MPISSAGAMRARRPRWDGRRPPCPDCRARSPSAGHAGDHRRDHDGGEAIVAGDGSALPDVIEVAGEARDIALAAPVARMAPPSPRPARQRDSRRWSARPWSSLMKSMPPSARLRQGAEPRRLSPWGFSAEQVKARGRPAPAPSARQCPNVGPGSRLDCGGKHRIHQGNDIEDRGVAEQHVHDLAGLVAGGRGGKGDAHRRRCRRRDRLCPPPSRRCRPAPPLKRSPRGASRRSARRPSPGLARRSISASAAMW